MRNNVARLLLLVAASIFGMSLLGVAAYTAATQRDGEWSEPWSWEMALIAGVVAAIVGLFSVPFVCGFLFRADLRKSLPRIYGTTLVLVSVWAMLFPWGFGISAASIAYLSVIICCGWCESRYPVRSTLGRCEKCDYDLTGCAEPGCPECGWGRPPISDDAARP